MPRPAELGGYVYFPDQPNGLKRFAVTPVDPRDPSLESIAQQLQMVRRNALVDQLQGLVSEERVELSANPQSGARVLKEQIQLQRLQISDELGSIRKDVYIAEARVPETDGLPTMLGFSSATEVKYGDVTPMLHLREVCVDPRYQNRGVGTALLRSALDDRSPSTEVSAMNFANLNPRYTKLLEGLGFCAIGPGIDEEWFGSKVGVRIFQGQTVDFMIATLEARHRFLQNRMAFAAPEKKFL